jgi:hypothetical protein
MEVQVNVHRGVSIRAIKTDGSWSAILKSHLGPRAEHITGGKDGLWRDDRLNYVGAVETELPVDQAIVASEWCIPLFGASIVRSYVCPINSNRYSHRGDVYGVDQCGDVACDADVSPTIHQAGDTSTNAGC